MKIYQSRIFKDKIKKFSKQEKGILDEEIKRIIENPLVGEERKGDLRGVYIHKFKIKKYSACRMINNELELIMIGPHENYYRA